MLPNPFNNMDPVELGRRLAAARRSCNLSQEEIAQHLGVSRPTIVAMEKGTRAVKARELVTLAELFRRSVHELLGQRAFVAEFAPQFRATQFAEIIEESKQQAIETFERACEDYLMLEQMLNAPMPRSRYPEPYSIAGLSAQAAAEEVASLERNRLNLGNGPLLNLLEVLEAEAGLRVFVLALNEFRIAGMFAYTDRLGGCILINGKHPVTRQNWSAAHEYGHFLTDRYRGDVTVFADYERRPRSEQFADCFAASFLMPAAGLRQRFRRVIQASGDFTVADLCLLADQYEVSVEAMTRRLESLGCVRRGTWDKLARGFEGRKVQSYLGFAARQPRSLYLPERYRRLAVQAFEEELISESRLVNLLRCSRVEAREIVDALTQPEEVDKTTGIPYQLRLTFRESLDVVPAERE